MRWAIIATVGLSSCWQPPEPPLLPPVETAPSEEELLNQRPYVSLIPTGYEASTKWPLLLVLHGYGGEGEQTLNSLRLTELKPKMLIVAPNGKVDSRRARAWHPGPRHSPYWDVEYLTAIIHDMQRKYAIDPGKVFVVGHSQGAHMAHRMACDAANDVAAVVSVAGQVTMVQSACAPSRTVSVLQVHGDQDEAIGYYGDVQHDPPDPTVPSARQTVDVWARNNKCTGTLTRTGRVLDLDSRIAGSETTVDAFAECPPGISTELWTMTEVGHNPVASDQFAPSLAAFLTAHSRP